MSNNGLKLASDFDAATDADWRLLVEKTLRGKPFDSVMQSRTYDDIALDALYTLGNAQSGPQPSVSCGPWGITVPHWNPDAAETGKAILEDLEGGATGVALRLQAGAFPGVGLGDIGIALKDVHLNMASLTLVPGEEYEAGAKTVLALLEDRSYKPDEVCGTLGIDPISTLAQTGRLKEPAEHGCSLGASIAAEVAEKYPGLNTFMADGGLYHMSGATEAQELGLMLGTGLAYLRSMEHAGMDLKASAGQISFSLSADADILLTIAKFRAARILWEQVLASCGVSGVSMKLSAVSSLRMVSVNDPWVNILRSTSACFGAGIGGADNVCILPHDTMLGMSSTFARRIARNIQIILQEESGLSKVSDPAAGSFTFESITLELSNKAWKYFNKIELQGGIIASLRSGAIQADLRASWAERQLNISTRRDSITGISEFPNIAEESISDIGEVPSMVSEIAGSGDTVEPIEFHRSSEDFETLRAFSDACHEKNGYRPSVYLANIGSATEYSARSAFAKNYFEAGGIEALLGSGAVDGREIANAFQASGARIAVLCSSDPVYEKRAVEVVAALKLAGASRIYLAGRPKDTAAFNEAGVDEYIYAGCDILQSLAHAHSVIGADA